MFDAVSWSLPFDCACFPPTSPVNIAFNNVGLFDINGNAKPAWLAFVK